MIKIFENMNFSKSLLNNLLNNICKSNSSIASINSFNIFVRSVNTVPDRVIEKTRSSKFRGPSVENDSRKPHPKPQIAYTEANRDYKFIYPDFLPNPVYYFRDKVREKLERIDMINRRKQISIPEFYVGSIMAVVVSDPYAPGKTNRFVGICIRRDGYGLRHTFTLRNVVDGLGVEVLYDMYNPTIQAIEVLKLEKRLDDNLTYLQDCPPEYSAVPFDFVPIKLLPGAKVPVNTIKVPLNKKPWRHRWDRRALKGVIYPESYRYEYAKYMKSTSDFKPYERWDLMKHYRETIHDDDQREVFEDLQKYEIDVQDKSEVVTASKKLVRARKIPSDYDK